MANFFPSYPVSDWYEPDVPSCDKISAAGKITLACFHAPWCGDCEYTMPLVKSILNKLKSDNITVLDVEVDKQKKDPKGLAEKYNVSRIPTLILLRDDKELHRIVEYP